MALRSSQPGIGAEDSNQKRSSFAASDQDDYGKYPDSRCGLTGKGLIVPPISEKTAPKMLRDQWSLAKSILSECEKLVVFGFAFNDYDTAIRKFVAKNTKQKATIVLVDITDHRKRLATLLDGHELKFVDTSRPKLLERIHAAAVD